MCFVRRNPNRYSEPEIALNCGSVLREVIRHEPLNEMLLNSPLFDAFFQYVPYQTARSYLVFPLSFVCVGYEAGGLGFLPASLCGCGFRFP